MKYLPIILLLLPFALAQELTIPTYSGQDNVNGYLRNIDTLTIHAITSIPGDSTITTDQVRLYYGEDFLPFDTCTKEGTLHKCTYTDELELTTPETLTIKLTDDSTGAVKSEKTITLTPDTIAPKVTTFNVSPIKTSGTVTFEIKAEDYGTINGLTANCSGIKTINITDNETTIHTENAAIGTCNYNKTITYTFTTTGQKTICAIATDHLGKTSAPKCTGTITVDNSAPTIQEYKIVKESKTITHVRPGEKITATALVRATDDSGINTIIADFSQLNPDETTPRTYQRKTGDVYEWDVIVQEATPCTTKFTAKDNNDNEKTQTYDCTIRADNTPPTIGELLTPGIINGTKTIGKNARLTLELNDLDNTNQQGAGFMQGFAYLALGPLGDSTTTKADYCEKMTGTTWHCHWTINPTNDPEEGTFTISATTDTRDDLNNAVQQGKTFTVKYDNKGPETPTIVTSRVITGQSGVVYQGGAVKDDTIEYTVASSNFTKARANFTGIGGDFEKLPTQCNLDSTTQKTHCTFTQIITLSGPYSTPITFTFTDEYGNYAKTTTQFNVYTIGNEINPAYWRTTTAKCSPIPVDRNVASRLPTIIACDVPLFLQTQENIQTLAINGPTTPLDCVGDVTGNINELFTTNNQEGSKHPYIFIKLEPKEFIQNNISIKCPISVFSKKITETGTTITPQPQQLWTNITITFHNNPTGDLYGNYKNQLESSLNNDLVAANFITDLSRILTFAQKLCDFKVLMTDIIGTWYILVDAFSEVSKYLAATPGAQAAAVKAEELKTEACLTKETAEEKYASTLSTTLNEICAWTSCTTAGYDQENIQGVNSGGIPACRDWNQAFTTSGGIPNAEYTQQYTDPKESLIISTMCGCIPGIINGLEKLRETQCYKTVCLYDDVREGTPVSFCNEMSGYLQCTYVVGELASLIPFKHLVNNYMNMLKEFYAEPLSIFTTAIGSQCEVECFAPGSTLYRACSVMKTIAVMSEAMASWKQMRDQGSKYTKPDNAGYCERAQEIKEELKETQ